MPIKETKLRIGMTVAGREPEELIRL